MDTSTTSHPLLILLSDLKSSLSKFQDEAHAASVKLQHHSLSTSRALDRAQSLEHENAALNNEVSVLRSHPHPHPSSFSNGSADSSKEKNDDSINQLTLSLRTLSSKLTTTESLLSRRTSELTQTRAELQKSKLTTETAYELSARIRGREEALKSRERELELKVQLAEDRARMSERAVEDYACLVRNLEGRSGGSGNVGNVGNGHAQSRYDSSARDEVQEHTEKLLREFADEREHLQIQLSSAQHDLALLTSQHSAVVKSSEMMVKELEEMRMKMELLERDDTTAAKMVSRYMKFSQTQTNHLQQSLTSLSTRHTSTLSSLTSQITTLKHQLTILHSHNERLLSAIDELGNELLKESFGRRQEVRMRIRLVGREEKVLEGLRRWLRRAEERLSRGTAEAGVVGEGHGGTGVGVGGDVAREMIQDAKILIDNLDNPLVDRDTELPPVSGSLARLITIQSAVDDLVRDVQAEQQRRIEAERRVVYQDVGVAMTQEHEQVSPLSLGQQQSLPPLNDTGSTTSTSALTLPLNATADNEHSSLSPEATATLDADVQPARPITPTIEVTPPPVSSLSPPQSSSPPLQDSPSVPSPPPPEFSSAQEGAMSTPEVTIDSGTTEEMSTITPPRSSVFTGVHDSPEPLVSSGLETIESACVDIQVEDEERGQVDLQQQQEEEQGIPRGGDRVEDIGSPGKRVAVAPTRSSWSTGDVDVDGHNSGNECVEALSGLEDDLQSDTEARGVGRNVEGDIDTIASGKAPIKSPEPPALAHPQPSRPPPLSSLSLESPTELTPQLPLTSQVPPPSHPLLRELVKARNRYDDIQRAFHACHISLEGLKASLPSTSSSAPAYPRYPTTSGTSAIPNDILAAIVQRLDDYTEDARVELEIRISDEEVLARGYEALLTLPGALPSPASASMPDDASEQSTTPVGSLVEVEAQIRAFINGTDPTIERAMNSFTKKLEDIEHDVVAVKKAMHDPDSFIATPYGTDTSEPNTSTSGGGGWTSWIKTPISRPTTPTPSASGSTTTFGSIMTSRTRSTGIRRTSSAFGLSADSSIPSSSSSHSTTDLVTSLGLKVPMPDFTFALATPRHNAPNVDAGIVNSFGFGGLGLGSIHSPGTPRSRTISSSMYMLGMGMGSPGVGASVHGPRRSPMRVPSSLTSPVPRRAVSSAIAVPGVSHPGGPDSSAVGRAQDEEEEDVD